MNLIDRDEMISVFREAGKYQLTLPEVTEAIRQHPTVNAFVFPCKVGDMVWIVGHRFPAVIEEIRITDEGIFFVYAEYDRGYELTETWDDGEFQVADIGKTVFLTREEAESALARKDDSQ